MKHLLCALCSLAALASASQPTKIKADKYPSLLWEIRTKGAPRPSYLFGTMHVSSKMAFNLSDSFYLGIKNAQVVALETNPATWQEDFSRYDMEAAYGRNGGDNGTPADYLTINSLRFNSYEKLMEAALYTNPSILNNFLYRSRAGQAADFEEDTYLDLHIFQSGKKLGKKVCGVEDFDGSMRLVKEAYADAAKEQKTKDRSYNTDEELSYARLEEAYRTGNLDLLDTINKVNSQSAAFTEKFLYRRNEIQARAIDSILKKGQTLFVGVGAAHLPGSRGVIEWLRRAGYSLRPVKMRVRDSRHKEEIEAIRVPVQFAKQTAPDGFFSVSAPGKLYDAGSSLGLSMQQYADMTNGSYYVVTRLFTNAVVLGQSEAQVERKLDSVLYENIPGKILSKQAVVRNGYRGFDVLNRTRRGDYQRHQIFVTPFEIVLFKMSGNGDYVTKGTEATQFFSSIQLKPQAAAQWRRFSPAAGGFDADLPGEPQSFENENRYWAAYDAASNAAYEIIRTDVHNHSFLEEDSFDLGLMEESFASSPFVQRQTMRQFSNANGYPALDAAYVFTDSSVAAVRFVLQGPHYYTLVAKGPRASETAQRFLRSFHILPFRYGAAAAQQDTALHFTVRTPVPLERKRKLSLYPDAPAYGSEGDDSLVDNGRYLNKVIAADSTGEKIYVSYFKASAYNSGHEDDEPSDSSATENEWIERKRKVDSLADGTVITAAEFGAKNSSRMLKLKTINRNDAGYELQTQLDTLSAPSAFVTQFFDSFRPTDTLRRETPREAVLFFSQFFSADTLQHKTAVKNIGNVSLDSSDFSLLKKAIESLTWTEKKYLDVKKEFVRKLGWIQTPEAADYLRQIYTAAGDTVELQHAALEALVSHQTVYAYKVFAGIMESDPPVLTEGAASLYDAASGRSASSDEYEGGTANGSFLDNLTDSLELTAGIYKSLLPLWNLDDYEQPLMQLTALLLDSNRIAPKAYEAFVPKLLIEAKQALKKQVIREKARAIEKAQQDETEKARYSGYNRSETDNGNSGLSLYAALLLPYWDKNPQVAPLLQRMLSSQDRRLRYNTALLLLRKNRPVPDSVLQAFAASDDYRYELYSDLHGLKKLARFPAAYKTQELLAKSQLLYTQYNKPDTLAFLKKLPLSYKGRNGFVYVFTYKENKADPAWKFATVGLLPADTAAYFFDEKAAQWGNDFSFTELTSVKRNGESSEDEALQKLLKKLVYKKRKSAAQFYTEQNDYRSYRNNEFGD